MGPLNPHEIPHQDVHPQFIFVGRPPCILVQPKRIALPLSSLLGDAKVCPIHQYKAVVAYLVNIETTVKINLRFGGEAVRLTTL
jgi:hypothetical protein